MQGVANEIVAATERQHGVVERSSVDTHGQSGSASFSVAVPSARLGSLIATLSALANVRALTQSTRDITDGYNLERARLADRVTEYASLLKRLAIAAPATEVTSMRPADRRARSADSGGATRARPLAEPGTHGSARRVRGARSSAKHSITAGPLSRAFGDAAHPLEEILAIALIALAIVLLRTRSRCGGPPRPFASAPASGRCAPRRGYCPPGWLPKQSDPAFGDGRLRTRIGSRPRTAARPQPGRATSGASSTSRGPRRVLRSVGRRG